MTTDPIRTALARLVQLKDGPRDEHYRATKDAAWQDAREALAAAELEVEGPEPTPEVRDAIRELRDLTACDCEPTRGGIDLDLRHEPGCIREYRPGVEVLAAALGLAGDDELPREGQEMRLDEHEAFHRDHPDVGECSECPHLSGGSDGY